jgi:inner membrane protein
MNLPPKLPLNAERFARRNAAGLKLLFVGALVLLLLGPLYFVRKTLDERLGRYDAAVGTITQTWGKTQRLVGPVLVVPYTYKTDTEEWIVSPEGRRYRDKVSRTNAAEAFFLPDVLEADGQIEPSARRLGIYSTHVYAAKLRFNGRFAAPSLGFTGVANPEPQWDRARVCFAISDLRGTREALVLKWGAADVALQPGARLEGFGPGLHGPVKVSPDSGAIEFSLGLTLNGSGGLSFVPLGRQTVVKLASPWPAPGFQGAFLPVQREVTPGGFNATWQVSYYGRDFPQQWSSGTVAAPAPSAIEAASFGVQLVETVTAYRTIERAIKYGVLFLALVFVTFFLFEVLSAVRLNALNYLLVGGALCLFYLGLLSLSEFIGFPLAYAGAATVSVLLIGLYGRSVLQSTVRSLLVCGMLGGVYGYLYFVLQMEDFSLLAGTAALFALLAAVMFATRRLDSGESAAAFPVAEVVS